MKKLLTLLFTSLLISAPAYAETDAAAKVETKTTVKAEAPAETAAVQANVAEGVEILPEAPRPKSNHVEYVEDPVYVPLGGPNNHPMQELFDLAEDQDPRAQYILADLYSKGKGGIGKNVELAKMLFEHSAKLGNHDSLIRLAALAKRDNNKIEAYKWYELATARLTNGETLRWAREHRNALDLNLADRRKAEEAAKTWERAKLAPLNLHTPLNPLKNKPSSE